MATISAAADASPREDASQVAGGSQPPSSAFPAELVPEKLTTSGLTEETLANTPVAVPRSSEAYAEGSERADAADAPQTAAVPLVPPKAAHGAASSVSASAAAASTTVTSAGSVNLPAEEVVVLIEHAGLFGAAERGLWHYANLQASLPRRLWRLKDRLAIISASGRVPGFSSGGDVLHASQLPPNVTLRIGEASRVTYVYAAYRLCIALDLSASMWTPDAHSTALPFSDAAASIATYLAGLVQPALATPLTSICSWNDAAEGALRRMRSKAVASRHRAGALAEAVAEGERALASAAALLDPPRRRHGRTGGMASPVPAASASDVASLVSRLRQALVTVQLLLSAGNHRDISAEPSGAESGGDGLRPLPSETATRAAIAPRHVATRESSGSDSDSDDERTISVPEPPPLVFFAPQINVSVVAQAATGGMATQVEAARQDGASAAGGCARCSTRAGHHAASLSDAAAAAAATGSASCECGSLSTIAHQAPPPPPRLLVHGWALTSETLPSMLDALQSGLRQLESDGWEKHAASASTPAGGGTLGSASVSAGSGARGGAASGHTASHATGTHQHLDDSNDSRWRAGVAPLLETAIYTLKLLPSEASPSVTLVTDCVGRLPRCADYGSLVMQMARHDVSCSVLQLGTCSGVHAPLGAVPDSDGHAFLASATGGYRLRQRELASFCALPPSAESALSRSRQLRSAVAAESAAQSALATEIRLLRGRLAVLAKSLAETLVRVKAAAGLSVDDSSGSGSGSASASVSPALGTALSTSNSGLVVHAVDRADSEGLTAALVPFTGAGAAASNATAFASVSTQPVHASIAAALASGAPSSQSPHFSTDCWSPLQRATFARRSLLPSTAPTTSSRQRIAQPAVTATAPVGAAGQLANVSGVAAAPQLQHTAWGFILQQGQLQAQALLTTPQMQQAAAAQQQLQLQQKHEKEEQAQQYRNVSLADYAFPWRGPPPPPSLMRLPLAAYKLPLREVRQLLEARLKEGFRILQAVQHPVPITVGVCPAPPAFVTGAASGSGSSSSAGSGATALVQTLGALQLVLPWQTHATLLYTMEALIIVPAPAPAAAGAVPATVPPSSSSASMAAAPAPAPSETSQDRNRERSGDATDRHKHGDKHRDRAVEAVDARGTSVAPSVASGGTAGAGTGSLRSSKPSRLPSSRLGAGSGSGSGPTTARSGGSAASAAPSASASASADGGSSSSSRGVPAPAVPRPIIRVAIELTCRPEFARLYRELDRIGHGGAGAGNVGAAAVSGDRTSRAAESSGVAASAAAADTSGRAGTGNGLRRHPTSGTDTSSAAGAAAGTDTHQAAPSSGAAGASSTAAAGSQAAGGASGQLGLLFTLRPNATALPSAPLNGSLASAGATSAKAKEAPPTSAANAGKSTSIEPAPVSSAAAGASVTRLSAEAEDVRAAQSLAAFLSVLRQVDAVLVHLCNQPALPPQLMAPPVPAASASSSAGSATGASGAGLAAAVSSKSDRSDRSASRRSPRLGPASADAALATGPAAFVLSSAQLPAGAEANGSALLLSPDTNGSSGAHLQLVTVAGGFSAMPQAASPAAVQAWFNFGTSAANTAASASQSQALTARSAAVAPPSAHPSVPSSASMPAGSGGAAGAACAPINPLAAAAATTALGVRNGGLDAGSMVGLPLRAQLVRAAGAAFSAAAADAAARMGAAAATAVTAARASALLERRRRMILQRGFTSDGAAAAGGGGAGAGTAEAAVTALEASLPASLRAGTALQLAAAAGAAVSAAQASASGATRSRSGVPASAAAAAASSAPPPAALTTALLLGPQESLVPVLGADGLSLVPASQAQRAGSADAGRSGSVQHNDSAGASAYSRGTLLAAAAAASTAALPTPSLTLPVQMLELGSRRSAFSVSEQTATALSSAVAAEQAASTELAVTAAAAAAADAGNANCTTVLLPTGFDTLPQLLEAYGIAEPAVLGAPSTSPVVAASHASEVPALPLQQLCAAPTAATIPVFVPARAVPVSATEARPLPPAQSAAPTASATEPAAASATPVEAAPVVAEQAATGDQPTESAADAPAHATSETNISADAVAAVPPPTQLASASVVGDLVGIATHTHAIAGADAALHAVATAGTAQTGATAYLPLSPAAASQLLLGDGEKSGAGTAAAATAMKIGQLQSAGPLESATHSTAALPSTSRVQLPTPLLLMYTPLASLPLSAWHRWFDVERLEVSLQLPRELAPHALAADVGQQLTRSDTPLRSVQAAVHVPLPADSQAVRAFCSVAAGAAATLISAAGAPAGLENAAAARAVAAATSSSVHSLWRSAGERLSAALPSLLPSALLAALRGWAHAELPSADRVFAPAGMREHGACDFCGGEGSSDDDDAPNHRASDGRTAAAALEAVTFVRVLSPQLLAAATAASKNASAPQSQHTLALQATSATGPNRDADVRWRMPLLRVTTAEKPAALASDSAATAAEDTASVATGAAAGGPAAAGSYSGRASTSELLCVAMSMPLLQPHDSGTRSAAATAAAAAGLPAAADAATAVAPGVSLAAGNDGAPANDSEPAPLAAAADAEPTVRAARRSASSAAPAPVPSLPPLHPNTAGVVTEASAGAADAASGAAAEGDVAAEGAEPKGRSGGKRDKEKQDKGKEKEKEKDREGKERKKTRAKGEDGADKGEKERRREKRRAAGSIATGIGTGAGSYVPAGSVGEVADRFDGAGSGLIDSERQREREKESGRERRRKREPRDSGHASSVTALSAAVTAATGPAAGGAAPAASLHRQQTSFFSGRTGGSRHVAASGGRLGSAGTPSSAGAAASTPASAAGAGVSELHDHPFVLVRAHVIATGDAPGTGGCGGSSSSGGCKRRGCRGAAASSSCAAGSGCGVAVIHAAVFGCAPPQRAALLAELAAVAESAGIASASTTASASSMSGAGSAGLTLLAPVLGEAFVARSIAGFLAPPLAPSSSKLHLALEPAAVTSGSDKRVGPAASPSAADRTGARGSPDAALGASLSHSLSQSLSQSPSASTAIPPAGTHAAPPSSGRRSADSSRWAGDGSIIDAGDQDDGADAITDRLSISSVEGGSVAGGLHSHIRGSSGGGGGGARLLFPGPDDVAEPPSSARGDATRGISTGSTSGGGGARPGSSASSSSNGQAVPGISRSRSSAAAMPGSTTGGALVPGGPATPLKPAALYRDSPAGSPAALARTVSASGNGTARRRYGRPSAVAASAVAPAAAVASGNATAHGTPRTRSATAATTATDASGFAADAPVSGLADTANRGRSSTAASGRQDGAAAGASSRDDDSYESELPVLSWNSSAGAGRADRGASNAGSASVAAPLSSARSSGTATGPAATAAPAAVASENGLSDGQEPGPGGFYIQSSGQGGLREARLSDAYFAQSAAASTGDDAGGSTGGVARTPQRPARDMTGAGAGAEAEAEAALALPSSATAMMRHRSAFATPGRHHDGHGGRDSFAALLDTSATTAGASAAANTSAIGGICSADGVAGADVEPLVRVLVPLLMPVTVRVVVTSAPLVRLLVAPPRSLRFPRALMGAAAAAAAVAASGSNLNMRSHSDRRAGGDATTAAASSMGASLRSAFLAGEAPGAAALNSVCCGGTPIPQSLLSAMLWHRHWRYAVLPIAGVPQPQLLTAGDATVLADAAKAEDATPRGSSTSSSTPMAPAHDAMLRALQPVADAFCALVASRLSPDSSASVESSRTAGSIREDQPPWTLASWRVELPAAAAAAVNASEQRSPSTAEVRPIRAPILAARAHLVRSISLALPAPAGPGVIYARAVAPLPATAPPPTVSAAAAVSTSASAGAAASSLTEADAPSATASQPVAVSTSSSSFAVLLPRGGSVIAGGGAANAVAGPASAPPPLRVGSARTGIGGDGDAAAAAAAVAAVTCGSVGGPAAAPAVPAISAAHTEPAGAAASAPPLLPVQRISCLLQQEIRLVLHPPAPSIGPAEATAASGAPSKATAISTTGASADAAADAPPCADAELWQRCTPCLEVSLWMEPQEGEIVVTSLPTASAPTPSAAAGTIARTNSRHPAGAVLLSARGLYTALCQTLYAQDAAVIGSALNSIVRDKASASSDAVSSASVIASAQGASASPLHAAAHSSGPQWAVHVAAWDALSHINSSTAPAGKAPPGAAAAIGGAGALPGAGNSVPQLSLLHAAILRSLSQFAASGGSAAAALPSARERARASIAGSITPLAVASAAAASGIPVLALPTPQQLPPLPTAARLQFVPASVLRLKAALSSAAAAGGQAAAASAAAAGTWFIGGGTGAGPAALKGAAQAPQAAGASATGSHAALPPHVVQVLQAPAWQAWVSASAANAGMGAAAALGVHGAALGGTGGGAWAQAAWQA